MSEKYDREAIERNLPRCGGKVPAAHVIAVLARIDALERYALKTAKLTAERIDALEAERDQLRAVCNELMFCCDNDAGTYDPHDIGKIVAMARDALESEREKVTSGAVSVTLRFSSPEARNHFMAGLSDGWGENACSLECADGREFQECDTFVAFVFGVDVEEEEETKPNA